MLERVIPDELQAINESAAQAGPRPCTRHCRAGGGRSQVPADGRGAAKGALAPSAPRPRLSARHRMQLGASQGAAVGAAIGRRAALLDAARPAAMIKPRVGSEPTT